VEPKSRLKQKYGRKTVLLIEVGYKVSPQRTQSGDYYYYDLENPFLFREQRRLVTKASLEGGQTSC